MSFNFDYEGIQRRRAEEAAAQAMQDQEAIDLESQAEAKRQLPHRNHEQIIQIFTQNGGMDIFRLMEAFSYAYQTNKPSISLRYKKERIKGQNCEFASGTYPSHEQLLPALLANDSKGIDRLMGAKVGFLSKPAHGRLYAVLLEGITISVVRQTYQNMNNPLQAEINPLYSGVQVEITPEHLKVNNTIIEGGIPEINKAIEEAELTQKYVLV